VFEDTNPTFASRVTTGDFVVAGKNFGLGSSREHAPLVIKISGVSAVLVKSAARIFYRNAINVGLPVLICDTDMIDDGDTLEVNLKAGKISDLTNKAQLSFSKMPEVMLRILDEGGLIPYIRKYKNFDVKLAVNSKRKEA
jgi:3-isopropylmalate/(R)-2-methylmalate dehydratase small subunit